jgi:hypothetical protein
MNRPAYCSTCGAKLPLTEAVEFCTICQAPLLLAQANAIAGAEPVLTVFHRIPMVILAVEAILGVIILGLSVVFIATIFWRLSASFFGISAYGSALCLVRLGSCAL